MRRSSRRGRQTTEPKRLQSADGKDCGEAGRAGGGRGVRKRQWYNTSMSLVIAIPIVVVTWLIATASSVLAIFFGLRPSNRRLRLAPVLAIAALTIGYLGFGRWSPFRFFPQVGYAYTSNNFEVQVASSWLFLGPLILGTAGLLVSIWKSRTSSSSD